MAGVGSRGSTAVGERGNKTVKEHHGYFRHTKGQHHCPLLCYAVGWGLCNGRLVWGVVEERGRSYTIQVGMGMSQRYGE